MSTDYELITLIGVGVSTKKLKKVIQPLKTEDQPRYDTNTGKVRSFEKVIVQQELANYCINGEEFQSVDDVELYLKNTLSLFTHHDYNNHTLYFGQKFANNKEYASNISLPFGVFNLDSPQQIAGELVEKIKPLGYDLPDIQLHFIPYIW